MPSSFQIGPLMLAADRALAVVLIAAFIVLASLIARKLDQRAERSSFWALVAGIVAARAGFVANNWDAFALEPTSILAFWQGGFSLIAGITGALAAIVLTMPRKQPAAALAGLVVMLGGAYFIGASQLRPAALPLPGQIALEGWSGESVTLADFRGRSFVINLWASWCLPCQREMPMLMDAASRSPIPILLVNSGEQRAAAAKFLQANRLPEKSVYLDPAAALAASLGTGGYPTTLFINAAGEIETAHLGEISRAMLASEMRALEKGRR